MVYQYIYYTIKQEVVYRQGYLTKQGGGEGFFGRMNWKKSFTSGNEPIKAPVDISYYTPSPLNGLQFTLLPNDKIGRKYIFESISIPDKEMWLEAFSKSLNPLSQSNTPIPIIVKQNSEKRKSIRKSKQMILKLTRYYLYITPYYQQFVDNIFKNENGIKNYSMEIENLLKMMDICPLQFIGYVISPILLLANEKQYISSLLKNKIIKRINKIFIRIVESNDDEQYTILTIQLLELLIKLCKSKKLVKYLSIEKKKKISINKEINSTSEDNDEDGNSGLDSDTDRKRNTKVSVEGTVEDTSIVILHLLNSTNEIILYTLSKFIKSYYLLCLQINKSVNSYILYQLLSKKYKVILTTILDIILQYSYHEEFLVNIFKQNEFLLDEILDQVMYISSVDNYESFIFILYSLCCYNYQLFSGKTDKINILMTEYNGDNSVVKEEIKFISNYISMVQSEKGISSLDILKQNLLINDI